MTELQDAIGQRPVDSYAAALERLCAKPHTQVTAIDDRGLFVPMPSEVQVGLAPLVSARSMVDVVEPASRGAVIDAWDRVRTDGAAHTRVTLRGAATAELYFFDFRSVHDVLIGVLASDAPIGIGEGAAYADPPPRLSLQRKNETARFIDIDAATSKMLGWSREDMIGRGSLEFVHPDDHDRAIESWMDMLGRPRAALRTRLRYRHADGSYVWLELTNRNLLDDPEDACVITEALNIDDEMAAHEAVRAREELLRGIAQTVPLGLAHLGPAGEIVYANDAFRELLATTSKPDDGSPFRNIVRADRTAFAAALAGVTTTGAEQEIEVTIAGRRRNDRRHCNVRLRPLHSANETISGAVVCVEDVTERVRARAELEHRATYDELTQCLNRSSILSKLDDVARARRSVGVIFVDVDDFKRVNDEFGHAAGDAVLVEVARRLRNGIRRDDHVGRVGGDEFLVVCDGIGDATDVNVIADRIRTHLGAPISIEDRELKVDASVGVAAAAPGWQPEALVANADAAMYENKRGRQRRR